MGGHWGNHEEEGVWQKFFSSSKIKNIKTRIPNPLTFFSDPRLGYLHVWGRANINNIYSNYG